MTNWQPALDSVQQNKIEIEQLLLGKLKLFTVELPTKGHFCHLDNLPEDLPFIDDFARIGAFLLDQQAVEKQLKRLNSELCIKAKERKLLINNSETEINSEFYKTIEQEEKQSSSSYLSHNKTLRQTVEEELRRFGFFPTFGKALDFIMPKSFRNALKRGIILKDPLVEETHGEFNHAIQWLLIAYQQEESPFLSHTVINIFNELGKGTYSVHYVLDDGSKTGLEENVWDYIVDAIGRPETDFRSPNSITKFLRNSDDPNLFLLKTLINSRIIKRGFHLFDSNKQQQKAQLSYGEFKGDILFPKVPSL